MCSVSVVCYHPSLTYALRCFCGRVCKLGVGWVREEDGSKLPAGVPTAKCPLLHCLCKCPPCGERTDTSPRCTAHRRVFLSPAMTISNHSNGSVVPAIQALLQRLTLHLRPFSVLVLELHGNLPSTVQLVHDGAPSDDGAVAHGRGI